MSRAFYLLKNIEAGIIPYPNNFQIYYNPSDRLFHSYLFNISNWEGCYFTETDARNAISQVGMTDKIVPVAVIIQEVS
jgi:hypothetical protein